eukprot:TRINITY_DN17930_c0_g2_i1.p1 TRINITY_DN17930_c0_g2~~TRINITY_DN17930_c0_g2_i1.p1  ORF type:complete len:1313 (+),score=184.29 TRINITY_DN17930_c0_g2_i1:191-4129(+)
MGIDGCALPRSWTPSVAADSYCVRNGLSTPFAEGAGRPRSGYSFHESDSPCNRSSASQASNGVFLTGCSFNADSMRAPSTPQLRRFPQLGEPMRGCRSSPLLSGNRSRASTQDDACDVAVTTVSSFNAASNASDRRRRKTAATHHGMKGKAWQVSAPGSRHLREEVLERDRQRQRQLYGWGEQRNVASPARSHACSLFYASVPDGSETAKQLPGPFRLVARPQTQPRVASVPGSKSPAGKSAKEEDAMMDADLVFSQEEMTRLNQVLDDFVALIKPPNKEDDHLTQTRLLAEPGRMDLATTRELDRQGPLVLRPLFCRFLLASKLCGTGSFKYHECVSAFDESATSMGTYLAMPRAIACNVIASIIMPKAGPRDPEAPPDPRLQKFFYCTLPEFQRHIDSRSKRLADLSAQTEAVEVNEVPSEVLTGTSLENIWPPLPPRSLSDKELACWTSGVRQWEDELCQQSASRLLALRAHTETVTRGEILSSQLIEPEVLHFVSRFKPLFKNMFTAYRDWTLPPKSSPPASPSNPLSTERRPMSLLPNPTPKPRAEPYPDPQEEVDLGHMTFKQFFRFCIDFGLYPEHVNFEELSNIYSNAECTYKEPSSPSGVGDDQASLDPPTPGKQGKPSASPNWSKLKSKKMQLVLAKASVAAVATADAMHPKVDLRFFEKPLGLMSMFEVKLVTFFATVDEWLSERFVRLADIIVKSDTPEEELAVRAETVEKAAMEASLVAMNIENGEFVVDPEQKAGHALRTKQEEEAALRAAMRAAANAAAAGVLSVAPVVAVSPAGLLEVVKPMKTAWLPSEDELNDMFRMLLGGPDESGRWMSCENVETSSSQTEESARHSITIPVFQLDKVLRTATSVLDKAKLCSCALMQTDAERGEQDSKSYKLFEDMDARLSERSKMVGPCSEDIFEDIEEVTPELILAKASELGILEDKFPPVDDLAKLMMEVSGSREKSYDKRIFYRALLFTHEGRRRHTQRVLASRLHCLTHSPAQQALQSAGPSERVFGLAAFVECLLKIALHRLGCKGSSEIQRGSPSWWKCTWLLTLLTSRFNEKTVRVNYERDVFTKAMDGEEDWEQGFANNSDIPFVWTETDFDSKKSGGKTPVRKTVTRWPQDETYSESGCSTPSEPAGGRVQRNRSQPRKAHQSTVAESTRVWWRKVHCGLSACVLPRNIPAMEWLATDIPAAFETWNCEEPPKKPSTPTRRPSRMRTHLVMPHSPQISLAVIGGQCFKCKQKPTDYGWGNPSCAECSGVDERCLPIEACLFRGLLRTSKEFLPTEDEEELDFTRMRRISRRMSVASIAGPAA